MQYKEKGGAIIAKKKKRKKLQREKRKAIQEGCNIIHIEMWDTPIAKLYGNGY